MKSLAACSGLLNFLVLYLLGMSFFHFHSKSPKLLNISIFSEKYSFILNSAYFNHLDSNTKHDLDLSIYTLYRHIAILTFVSINRALKLPGSLTLSFPRSRQ